jgi:hypothetical protein
MVASTGNSPGAGQGQYTLSAPAADLYAHLSKYRQQVIDKGREMASITIPSVMPPDGYRTGQNISEENQSVGALCVNTLASKLQYMGLPPDRPLVRFQPVDSRLKQQLLANPSIATMIQVALAKLELTHRERFEVTNMRAAYMGILKLLLVGGNGLWEHMRLDFPVFHTPLNYVVRRNPRGEQLLVILKRKMDMMDLDPDIKAMVYAKTPELAKVTSGKEEYETLIDIYCICKRVPDGTKKDAYLWEYWEEYEGERITGSEFESDYETPPLYAAWMIPVYGQNWGRGYCEEYQGDLYKVEGLEAAMNDGSALASLVLLFLKAGARTSIKQVKAAPNLAVLPGEASDLSAFQLNKGPDFQFVNTNLETAIKRLGRAFLLVSSVQRKGERVTAEEIRDMTDEIEEATGGLYTEVAQSLQRHVVRRAVALHNEEDKGLTKLPPGIFRVAVVTGVEAMGRTIEAQNLERAIGQTQQLFPEKARYYIKPGDAIRRIFSGESINQDGLIASDEEAQAAEQGEQQAAAKQTMIKQGTGPAAAALAKTMTPDQMAHVQQLGGTGPSQASPTAPPTQGA